MVAQCRSGGLISACLKHVVKLDGLALGVLYSFRFDFFTYGNSYGRLIRRKGLLIPFVSISLFFCRSNWLIEVDLSNRKTAFHKPSTFSAASIRALVRPRASSYRFFVFSSLSLFASWPSAIIILSKLQCGNPIYVVLMPVRSWLSRNKMLAKYPFAVKHVFRFRVSATDRFYFLFFSPLCSQFFLKFSYIYIYIYIYLVDKVPQDIASTVLNIYVHMHKLDKKDN